MKTPGYHHGQGIVEYLLMVIIVILFVLIITKLFGPAITNYIQNLLQNIS